MSYILSDAPQGSDAWLAARLGRLTGSVAGEALAHVYSSAKWEHQQKRAIKMAIERITQKVPEGEWLGKDVERGRTLEPFARMAYELKTGEMVREAGFAYLPTIMAGCSVDGFVGDDGVVEIKCPLPHVHVGYMLGGMVPREYVPQVMHNLWVTNRRWCDFVSYCDELPEKLRLLVIRYEPTDNAIRAHQQAALRFLFDVSEIENKLRERMQ